MSKTCLIIPIFNEQKNVSNFLEKIIKLNADETIVVDGKSTDQSVEIVKGFNVKLIAADRGRAKQMNFGASSSTSDILIFLHADSLIDNSAVYEIKESIAQGFVGGGLSQRIDSKRVIFRFIESSGNIRAKLLKIFYGDQAIFVRRDVFFSIGGFDDVPILEDILFSKKLKKNGRTCLLKSKVITSPRRWLKQGVIKTTLINWIVIAGSLFSIPEKTLKKIYSETR
ncbi:MAG: TIGR04283 family arsenosugar biosynthesis glycosyltransferase [Candidatus Omnitrophica bacterium]|nr:TIGR04283 family arsenosugar biosynthesis glycosyltransferase [Candidatus Omnitrophota bacterium]